MATAPITPHRGFTLIEVLVTVAIVGVLAAIALPSYTSFVTKSQIRTAQADLLALSLNIENRYQRTLAYPLLDSSNADTTSDLKAVFNGWSPASGEFVFSAASDGETYTLTATGSGSKLSGCILTLDEENTRTAANCPHTSGAWL